MSRYLPLLTALGVSVGLGLSTLSGGWAGEAKDRITATAKLVVATDSAWPPFSWRDANGTWAGFDVDVATEIAKRISVKAEFAGPPWEEQTAGHWNGKWDACVC